MSATGHERLFSATLERIASPAPGGGSLMRQMEAIDCCDAFAIRHSDGRTGLELRLAGLREAFSVPSMKGVGAAWGERDGSPVLSLDASAPDVAPLFTSLADDLMAWLQPLDSVGQGCDALVMRLEQWQAFLASCSPGGLGSEKQAGLHAELLFLRNRLVPAVGSEGAVRAWKGGDQASHDFQLAGCAIEVKSSRRETLSSVAISSVLQLEVPEHSSLLLSVWHLQQSEAGGETLPELVDQLRENLPLAARSVLDDGLRRYGYLEAQRHLYEKTGYTIRAVRHYAVAAGFPRIRARDLPEGVSEVKYRVGLVAAGDFLIEEESVGGFLTGADS